MQQSLHVYCLCLPLAVKKILQKLYLPLSTTAATNITSTTATGGASITSDGGSAVTARGVCWSTSQNFTASNNKTTDGSGIGSFTSSITGLTSGATYYVRTYATNSAGTSYGNQITLTSNYSITITISGKGSVISDKATVSLGGKVELTALAEKGYSLYKVKVNGVDVGIIPTDVEFKYSISDINSNHIVEFIFVETYNLFISILNPPLKMKAMDIYKEDGTYLFSIVLTQEMKERRSYYYYPEGRTVSLMLDGSESFSADWSISQNILRVGLMNYTIIELTPTKLVYKAPPGKDPTTGIINYAQYTYERN